MIIRSSTLRFITVIFPFIFGNYRGRDLNGDPISFTHFFTPYIVELRGASRQLIVKKRNWYFIGVDRRSFNFGQIRNILINEHVLLGDIQIRMYAGTVDCYWIRKKSLRLLEDEILQLARSGVDLGFIQGD